jgi:cytochrome bd-type quinol oxidase subunit 2
MPRRLIELLLALFLVGLAAVLIGPVAATMLTPGWLETADARHWASMTLFLCVAAILLVVAFRVVFRRDRAAGRVLGAAEWWAIAALSLVATVCAAIASHWTIALPGLLPIGIGLVLARRRGREERVTIADSGPPDLPPGGTFTRAQSFGRPSGKS